MGFRTETDADGRHVLIEKRARSRAARIWDRGELLVVIGCGLFILALLASIVRDALAGRADLTTVLIMSVLCGVPGTSFVVLGLLGMRRRFARTESTRHVLDEDAYEMLADYPDDVPVKRFLIRRGLL